MAKVVLGAKIGAIKKSRFSDSSLTGKTHVLLPIQVHCEHYQFLLQYCPLSFLPQENYFWWPGEITEAKFLQEERWDFQQMEIFVTNRASEDHENISSHPERSINTEIWCLEEQPGYHRDSTYDYCNKSIRVCQDDGKTK